MPRFTAILVALALAGCGTTARWRAGAYAEDAPDPAAGRPADQVDVFLEDDFGVFTETESEREFACATTTVLRQAFLLAPPQFVVPDSSAPAAYTKPGVGEPERDYDALGHVTTEEFPLDPARSSIEKATFSTWFGVGTEPQELWTARLAPDAQSAALERLCELAAKLGADAVIDVYATAEAEHHMWAGTAVSFNTRSTSSPVRASGELLDFRLRAVRLHGTAVRYE